jgi:hypothetical protein
MQIDPATLPEDMLLKMPPLESRERLQRSANAPGVVRAATRPRPAFNYPQIVTP